MGGRGEGGRKGGGGMGKGEGERGGRRKGEGDSPCCFLSGWFNFAKNFA